MDSVRMVSTVIEITLKKPAGIWGYVRTQELVHRDIQESAKYLPVKASVSMEANVLTCTEILTLKLKKIKRCNQSEWFEIWFRIWRSWGTWKDKKKSEKSEEGSKADEPVNIKDSNENSKSLGRHEFNLEDVEYWRTKKPVSNPMR